MHVQSYRFGIPALRDARLVRAWTGFEAETEDAMPAVGPVPGVPNAFEACVFTFGIAQGGGAGKVLAEWIVDGAPEWDMWSVDPRRFTDYTDHDHCVAKGMEMVGASSTLYPKLYLKDVVLANVVVLLLGFLASLSPAWRASRYEPVEAITKVG